MPSDGTKNLIPTNKRSKDEVKRNSRKGGIKSGEVRRARKTLREELLVLLSTGDKQEKMSLALIEKALKGDVKAFEVIRDSIGEKQVEKVQIAEVSNETISEIEEMMKEE